MLPPSNQSRAQPQACTRKPGSRGAATGAGARGAAGSGAAGAARQIRSGSGWLLAGLTGSAARLISSRLNCSASSAGTAAVSGADAAGMGGSATCDAGCAGLAACASGSAGAAASCSRRFRRWPSCCSSLCSALLAACS